MRGFMRFIRSSRLLTVLGGLTAAVTLTAADTRNGIRRIGRNIEASERSEEK